MGFASDCLSGSTTIVLSSQGDPRQAQGSLQGEQSDLQGLCELLYFESVLDFGLQYFMKLSIPLCLNHCYLHFPSFAPTAHLPCLLYRPPFNLFIPSVIKSRNLNLQILLSCVPFALSPQSLPQSCIPGFEPSLRDGLDFVEVPTDMEARMANEQFNHEKENSHTVQNICFGMNESSFSQTYIYTEALSGN